MSPSNGGTGGASGRGGDRFVARWMDLLRRRWAWGSVAFVTVMAVASAAVFLTATVWRGEARLRLSAPPPAPGVNPSGGFLSLFGAGGDAFANDMELLGSRTVAEGVVRAVALDVRVSAPPEWYRDSLFVELSSRGGEEEAVYEMTWDEGMVRVSRVEPLPAEEVAAAPVGAAVRFGPVELVARPRKPEGPASVRLVVVPFGKAAESFRSGLVFERGRRDANVLDMEYDHGDPGVAEEAVAAAIRLFVALRAELHERESGVTVDSLRSVVAGTAAELTRAEAALEAFQRETGFAVAEVQSEAMVTRYSEAEGRLRELEVRLELVDSVMARARAAENPGEVWSTLVSHPVFLENETVGQLLTRLNDLEQRRVELASRRSPQNREYRVLVEQIDLLDRSLRSVTRNYARTLAEQVGELRERVAILEETLTGLPARAIELGRLQRDVRLLTEVLLLTEQRLRQEELREALTFGNVQIIDPPELAPDPVWPRKKLGLAVGLLLASGFAFLTMVVVERADAVITDGEVVRGAFGVPVLAAPRTKRGEVRVSEEEARAVLSAGGGATGAPGAVVLAGVEEDDVAERVGDALRRVLASVEGSERLVTVAEPIRRYADAERLAGTPGLVVVVRHGSTPVSDVRRAAALLREAGGGVRGSVVVCRSSRDVEAVWS